MLPGVALLFFVAGRPAPAPPVAGEAVVRAAYDMYKGQWFKNVQFVQRTIFPTEGRVETWYIAVRPPGMTRVDVAPGATGRAIIYRSDSTYSFGKGQLRSQTAESQPLNALLHDLHTDAPEHTIALLKRFGFDLRKTYERMWQGQRVIVVGALQNDAASNQFWLEKKRMILVRLIEQNAADRSRPLEAQVSQYEKAGKGWLEHSVKVYLGGQLTTVQEYSSVVIDAPLEPALFEPVPYRLPQWVRGANDVFGGVPNISIPGGH